MSVPETAIETRFLPAGRAKLCDLTHQIQSMSQEAPTLENLLDAVPEVIAILNAERQIIFANHALASYLGIRDLNELYGRRPGEVLNCAHAFETKGGCGTTEFCTQCGAANAIHIAQTLEGGIRECHIAQRDGNALDFRVAAKPLLLSGARYTIVCLTDISGENRRRALERIFFHDVLNTATGVSGAAELISIVPQDKLQEMSDLMRRLSKRLINEIQGQREIAAAESGELEPHKVPCDPSMLVNEIAGLYRTHNVARGRHVTTEIPDKWPELCTDPLLLGRVLGNMLKNALEASLESETVRIGFDVEPDEIHFHVWNPGFIPRINQLQIFQRSFSTKGSGRGLGTYSMKLLGEKYLGGKVSFSTGDGEGTTFHLFLPRQVRSAVE